MNHRAHVGAAPGDVDDVLAMVRARGGRVTEARRAVVKVLLDGHGEHLTAEDVATRVQRRHPDVHLSTVYRTLEALEDLGVTSHVHLGHGASTYHLAGEHHHHVVCSRCGSVAELPDDVLGEISTAIEDATGVRLTQHFALAGLCAACRAADAQRTGKDDAPAR